MSIDRATLTADCKALQKTLVRALKSQYGDDADLAERWRQAREAGRTAATQIDWIDAELDQAAAHWILGCVFLRFLEDNRLVPDIWLAGREADSADLAQHQYGAFYRDNPIATDADFLKAAFARVARLPVGARLFDPEHNPLYRLTLPADAARALRLFWQATDAATGALKYDFADPALETRFLGDLYEDLSELARAQFALRQTPDFVEAFILDRTLDPAIKAYGDDTRLIDPACGSGHFLLGAFWRLLKAAAPRSNGQDTGTFVRSVLERVAGVDINPFGVAISRFRLTIAALRAGEWSSLAHMPELPLQVACGDSLLHGPKTGELAGMADRAQGRETGAFNHTYAHEDLDLLLTVLGRRYHAVVGNPPYITAKDAALNAAYRSRWDTCYQKYSLVCPFTERFFDLAAAGGCVGLIVSNSFMKRTFGKVLIQDFLASQVDLTHVIDTSGAYIPGHGTPTVVLLGRNRSPVSERSVRAVLGVKGEPSTPEDPAKGVVWSAIIDQVDVPGSESAYVSVLDLDRTSFGKHPWSLGGGGASELSTKLEYSRKTIDDSAQSVGISAFTLEDEFYVRSHREAGFFRGRWVREIFIGDDIRDWLASPRNVAIFPYSEDLNFSNGAASDLARTAWPYRTTLGNNILFGGRRKFDSDLHWLEFGRLTSGKLKTPLTITFAFVATHNHFVLDRGGKVFKQSAPVIKLPAGASEEDHLDLLGLLNCSTACFWMKQTFYPKGGDPSGPDGARLSKEVWDDRYEIAGTGLQSFPLASPAPRAFARELDRLGQRLAALRPAALIRALGARPPDPAALETARADYHDTRARMIAWQEELDWHCYRLYGILDDAALEYCDPNRLEPAPPPIAFGDRAFEIRMARLMAAGELETRWFERHGATPRTDLPDHWPSAYKALVEARIAAIDDSRDLELIERPECKRRWAADPWDKQLAEALEEWLADRLEDPQHWPADPPAVTTVARLADAVLLDEGFHATAALFQGRSDPDIRDLVEGLVRESAVPLAPAARFSEDGLAKRRAWEQVWELQRAEDRGEAVGEIPVPPKYKKPDYRHATYAKLRGSLDVPRERFLSVPGAERPGDPTLPILWAGYDHLQQAKALAALAIDLREKEGVSAERLLPVLAGILSLVPWVRQWHGADDADAFDAFLSEEATVLGLTVKDIAAWVPSRTANRRGRRRRVG